MKMNHYTDNEVEKKMNRNFGILALFLRPLWRFIYIFLFSFVLNIIIGSVGEERLSAIMNSIPVVGELVAALVGLIPNCASSVVITQLFIDGIIGPGPMFAGLLVNAGVGTLVLLKTNGNVKKSLAIIGLLYALGVVWGVLIELSALAF